MGNKNLKGNMFWVPVKKKKMHLAEWKSKNTTTFQQAMRATLIAGQVFSLLPVVGISSMDASDVKFMKISWKCLYSIISLIGQILISVLCVLNLADSESATLTGTSPIILYVTTSVTMVIFIQMAQRWPELVQHIAKTEQVDPHYNTRLTIKCNVTCGVVLILALMEHIFSLIHAFTGAMVCFSQKPLHEGFVMYFYPWVTHLLPYSPVLGFVIQLLHFQSTFVWNFSNVFVISLSYYLTSRLEQVNKKLLAAKGKYLPEVFWRATREDYCRVTQLVREVDNVISGVVLMSFANNLFFICLQLFNTLEDGLKGTSLSCKSNKTGLLDGREATIYFSFSLIFLLARSVAVSLIASQVNTASSVPAPVLYEVPSPVYCIEVQRFLELVNAEKVALSGLQFFYVTRGLLLTVAGTIVTYELVLFQFNSPPSTSPMNNTIIELSNATSTVNP